MRPLSPIPSADGADAAPIGLLDLLQPFATVLEEGLITCSAAGHLQESSPSFQAQVGRTLCPGEDLGALFVSDDRPRWREALAALGDGRPRSGLLHLDRPGTPLPLSFRASRLPGGAVVVAFSDLRAVRAAEARQRFGDAVLQAVGRCQRRFMDGLTPQGLLAEALGEGLALVAGRYGAVMELLPGDNFPPVRLVHDPGGVLAIPRREALLEAICDAATAASVQAVELGEAGPCLIAPLVRGGVTIGLIALGGGPRPLDPEEVAALDPFFQTCGALLATCRADLRRRAAEQQALLDRERYQQAMAVSSFSMWDWDLSTGRLECSESLYVILGQPRDADLAAAFGAHLHPDDHAPFHAALRAHILDGVPYDLRYRILRPDGGIVWLRSRGSALRDEQGRAYRMVGSILDITDQHAVEDNLIAARASAEGASRAKSEFLANASHELRTPLHAVIGIADLLRATPCTPEQAHYVSILRRSGANLLGLIDDLLDHSRIEAGQIDLAHAPFDLAETAAQAAETVAVQAARKGLGLALVLDPALPQQVRGDGARLRQVLVNLLGNATKFTQVGQVTLVVERTPDEQLRFAVEDTGPGIPADQLPHLFERFRQVDRARQLGAGGSGLGLAISQGLVRRMGGQIEVSSELDLGTTFSFSLPLPVVAGATPGPSPNPAAPYAIIADPRPRVADGLARALAAWGWSPIVACDAAEAVEAAAGRGAGRVGLALIGAQLPRAANLFDELPAARTVLVSGPQAPEPGLLARAAGQVLADPPTPARLGALLADAAARPERVAFPTSPGLDILIAEDNEDNVLILRAFLAETPHRLTFADDGAAALDCFRRSRYDLVLMDMTMPVMDGYAATRAMRALEAAEGRRRTPVVALTAHAISTEVARCLAAGCDGHLAKPLSQSALLNFLSHQRPRGD